MWEGIDYCYEAGWSDGLPVVPPAEGLVADALAEVGWDPGEVVLTEPVRGREVTAEKVAANAVMAGCLPAYLPVVRAALEAMSATDFHLHGPATSTGGATPLVIVNGPVRDQLGMNYRDNLFGSGNRPNATIGRAVRLVFLNCLSARPGILDRSTQGSFGKYSGCFPEHETASPWEPLSVSRGLRRGPARRRCSPPSHLTTSSAMARPCRSRSSPSPMAAMGSFSPGQSVVVVSPEHAGFLATARWSRRDVQEFLYAHARRRLSDLKAAGKLEGAGRRRGVGPSGDRSRRHPGAGGRRGRRWALRLLPVLEQGPVQSGGHKSDRRHT